MLDENLPAFFLKPSPTGIAHHRSYYLTHHGSEPEPCYTLQHADPASQASKNCYAAALFDAYNPDVLYGEVLARPTWTQPTLSAEEVRRNGGIPPPPQPILPTEFVIQLYNPDQQVTVAQKEGKWGGSTSYEFSMPQMTFRAPSASTLDRTQSDPASLAITPKVNFVWRKESKLSKDLTCFMTGKSTDTTAKKKSQRDPDIAVALFRSLREVTIYEPNLYRVEMEDPKGLEVTLLLAAAVIKDLYFSNSNDLKHLFNISDAQAAARKLSSGGRKLSSPSAPAFPLPGSPNPLGSHPVQPPRQSSNDVKRNSLPRLQTTPPQPSSSRPPPLADPRAQWELDTETARLKAEADAEEQARRRQRRERQKAEEAESRRLRKMVEQEEREARQKQAEIDRETERLRKEYGVQSLPERPRPQQNGYSRPPSNSSSRLRPQQSSLQPIPQRTQMNLVPSQPQRGSNGLYLQPPASSSAVMMSGANNASSLSVAGAGQQPQMRKKTSFWGIRSKSDDGQNTLRKKSSAMW